MENPALKLHSLLEEAYKSSADTDFKTAWCKVFAINENDTSALMNAMSALLNLLVETKDYVEQNERLNNQRNNTFIRKIEISLSSINFNGTMHHFKNNLDKEALTALSYIAESISFIYALNESKLDETEINNLIVEIDNLINNILESSLPNEVKTIMFRNLSLIQNSLQNYKISGYEGIKNALEQSVGSVFVNNKTLSPVSEDENVKGLFNIIDKLNSLLSTGVAIKELLPPILGLLLK